MIATVLLDALQHEKRTPSFIVLADDLLRRSGANEWDILLVGLRVPVQLQVVAVLLAVDVVDLVPELRGVLG
jgi:hypothetical protein